MKKNGFTLIELLAVIIILGILMIIAVPAVNKYINEARKTSYVDIAKNITSGVRNLIHSGDLDLNDLDTTYYIDGSCIKTNNSFKSPYGEFRRAYVVVTLTPDGSGHEYFWTSVDETGTGVKYLINVNKLTVDHIENGLSMSDITIDRGIDERSKIVVVTGESCTKGSPVDAGFDVSGITGKIITLCNRATTLHTATCQRTSDGCAETVGNGNTITYGTIPKGELKPGDAYDCDVNNDKIYDSNTERFYYITNDGENAVLMYYKNVDSPVRTRYATTNENWHGPSASYQHLPSKSVWKSKKIIAPGTRQILNDYGTNDTVGGTIDAFTYTDKAARLITYQELVAACGSSISSSIGSFDSCIYTLEKAEGFESNSYYYGYWIESPYRYSTELYMTSGNLRILARASDHDNYAGIRPVITTSLLELE